MAVGLALSKYSIYLFLGKSNGKFAGYENRLVESVAIISNGTFSIMCYLQFALE